MDQTKIIRYRILVQSFMLPLIRRRLTRGSHAHAAAEKTKTKQWKSPEGNTTEVIHEKIKDEFVTLVNEHGHIDYDSMCTKSGIVTAKLAVYAFLCYPLFVLDPRGAYINFKDRRAQHF